MSQHIKSAGKTFDIVLTPPKTLMDFFLNMINLGMNVVNVTAFKRFNFVNFVVPIIISLIESIVVRQPPENMATPNII
jgi:hypothetical protein